MAKDLTTGASAWLVSADMGLGHQRAAYSLRDLSAGRIINAADPTVATVKERKLWQKTRGLYEKLSSLNDLPLIGGCFFGMLDKIQAINPYYPIRDLSHATPQVKYLKHLINQGLGQQLVEVMSANNLPLVSTFYAVSIAAAEIGYNDVYLVATDADLNRVWAMEQPQKGLIKYFVPCSYTLNRLKEYGVPDESIWLTGFPLPKENLGGPELEVLKYDLGQRLARLDPNNRFWSLHQVEAEYYLTAENCHIATDPKLRLTFAVGGAGAQKEIGAKIINSLKKRIKAAEIQLNLIAGIRQEVADYFIKQVFAAGLEAELGQGIRIIYETSLEKYFDHFNLILRETDVLWTKPSELSFYSGLGLPIIMAPPLGSHEHINKKWLQEINAGISQQDPDNCTEWIFDLLNEGRLAEAAWNGFLKARKCGTFKIEEVITTGTMSRNRSPLYR